MRKAIALVFLAFFLSASICEASRSISITSDKNSLYGAEEMNVSASISGFTNGEKIYLKGAFFKDGSTNYFGLTKNGEAFIKNSVTATSQRQVEIGSWDTNTPVRSDFDDSGYVGHGDYKFKLGFYYLTSGGNLSSINWSNNILSIALDAPATTSIPAQSSTPTTSTTTSKSVTAVKTPTPTKTAGSLTSASGSTGLTGQMGNNSVKIAKDKTISSSFAAIRNLGPTKTNAIPKTEVLGASKHDYSLVTIIGGLILLVSMSGILIFNYFPQIKSWIEK